MDVCVSPAVASVLAAAGYRPLAVGADGAVVGTALDGTDRLVELHVLPGDATTVARAHTLRTVRHEHLVRVLEVVPLDTGELAVFTHHVRGVPLDALLATSPTLTDGEAATIAIPVAQALAALHAVGLQHAAVGGASILLEPDGRPVLAGLGATLRHVPRPQDDSADDVRALLDVLLPRLVEDDTADGQSPGLRSALAELRAEPGPEADRVVDRCFRVAVPVPLDVDRAVRRAPVGSDAELRAAASVPRRRARDSAAGPRPGTRPGSLPRDRARGVGPGSRLPVAVAGVVIAALVVGVVAYGPWRSTTTASAAPVASATPQVRSSAPSTSRPAPDDAAVHLTQQRAVLLASGATTALDQVEIPGSPAHVADSGLVGQLGGDRVSGLEVAVTEVQVLPAADEEPDEADEGETARVRLTSTTSAYRLVAADGTVRPGGAPSTATVVLVLRWTDQGWRVWDVLPSD